MIDGALKELPGQLAILDRAYGGRDYLVGAACYIPLTHDYPGAPEQLPIEQ